MEKEYGAENVPLAAYAALVVSYTVVFANLYYLCVVSGGPTRLQGVDFWLVAIASYKLSRLITMSFIGSVFRAPFATRGESKKGGEVQDQARGSGMRRALGNLVTCPFCFNIWSATLLTFGYSLIPDLTMQAAQILTLAAIGDLLHFGYRNLREKSE